ncbi:MAG: 3'(2'),5'-bisphosphate nucleotidase CysQ [Alphaproteobacteria bacterium]|nr:3'(2'),5'-bisphosphate nucleotidase CysQ [Alphaproteobacteria bacterium]
MSDEYSFNVDDVIKLIIKAGDSAMDIYTQDFAVYEKDDASPVTDADLGAEGIIYSGLSEITPNIAIVGEEHVAAGDNIDLSGEQFWLVDPVDGTADFVKKNGEWTVNIALIEGDKPIFGAVYVPVRKTVYYTKNKTTAVKLYEGKETVIKTRNVPEDGYSVLNSRTHCDESIVDTLLSGLKIKDKTPCGSSLKFCLLAEGVADVYPCSHSTHEWDTAAAQAVLVAAGGAVLDAETRQMLSYRKPNLANPHIISFGKV